MNICITGGSGFIGTKLTKMFVDSGHQVLILDLAPPREMLNNVTFIKVDLMKKPAPKEVLQCEAIVHLAGVNIFGRWTEEYKKLILDSRVKTATALIEAVKNSPSGPKVFVSASAIGYYGDGGEKELDEAAPAGDDFLATVCRQWEATAEEAEHAGMRTITVRTGIVLGPGGGMLAQLMPVFKWGLGGSIGSGKQWFSWIHLDDLINVYNKAVFDDHLSGPVNATTPYPIRNKDFAKALGKALRRPAVLPAPQFALRLLLGELADTIVMSQKVVPKKLITIDFKYAKPRIEDAIAASV